MNSAILIVLLFSQIRGVEKGTVEAAKAANKNNQQLQAKKADVNEKKNDNKIKQPDLPVINNDLPNNAEQGFGGIWNVSWRIIQIIDEDKVLASNVNTSTTYIIKGYSTKDKADGDRVRINEPMKFSGTESYTTVLGAKKTVKVLEPMTKKEIEELKAITKPILDKERERVKDYQDRTISTSEYRKWKYIKSGNIILAKIVAYTPDGTLVLREKNQDEQSTTAIHDINILSKNDIDFLKKLREKREKELLRAKEDENKKKQPNKEK